MAKIDPDGLRKFQNGVKNPLISIYDKLSKTGDFDKVKDEFDHMMEFVNEIQSWKDDTAQEVKVVVNDIHYKPADQQ